MTAQPMPTWLSIRSWPVAAVVAAVGSLLVVVVARVAMQHPPLYDELLHVLAARGVVDTGEPVIGDGRYGRAALFTHLVAIAFRWFGDSLLSARMPALLSAAILGGLVGAWVTRHAGLLAGLTTVGLFAASTQTIEAATFVRFYSLHALVIFVMSVAGFEALAVGRSVPMRMLLVALGIVTLPVAWSLQPTTIIAVGALVLAALVTGMTGRWRAILRIYRIRPATYTALLAISACLVLFLLWNTGILARASTAPVWAQEKASQFWYYNVQLVRDFPLIWPLFPLAVAAAWRRDRQLTMFCTVFCVSALAMHSISAAKASRYIYYMLPFMFALFGVGLATAIQWLADWVASAKRLSSSKALALALTLVVVVAALSQEAYRTARFLLGKASVKDLSLYASESDWSLAMPELNDRATSADTVVVSAGVKGLYYLDRYDFEINASAVRETEGGKEFGRDRRTGRQIISTADSLSQVIDESHSTLIVVDHDKLGQETGVPAAAISLMNVRCEPLTLSPDSGVLAWSCAGDGAG